MYSNQPVSMRWDLVVRASLSQERSETQLHSFPCSSGCMVSRKMTVLSPLRSRISVLAYSVKRLGQFSRSLVISQTTSIGALITISLSVCPAIVLPPVLSPEFWVLSAELATGPAAQVSLARDLLRTQDPALRTVPAAGDWCS